MSGLALAVLSSALLAAAEPAQPVVSDPTAAPVGIAGITAAGGAVWFSAVDAASGRELWRSDGSAAGTRRVVDLIPGPTGANPTELVAWQDGIAFVAADGEGGTALYRSDGTVAGTQRLTDSLPGYNWTRPRALAVEGDVLYFAVGDDEVWRTDGRLAGTAPLQAPTPSPYFNHLLLERIDAGPGFTLLTFNVGTECCQAFEVARADAATYRPLVYLTTVGGIPDARPTEFLVVGDRVAFAGNGYIHWTDGTTATSLPDDLDGFGSGARVSGLTPFGGGVAFAVSGTVDRDGLWLSDGTAKGTRRLAAFRELSPLAAVGDGLLFSARVSDEPWALWRADAGGATRLLDRVVASDLTGIDGAALFTRSGTLRVTTEIWVSDATAARTGRVQLLGGVASQFTVAADRLFFLVDSVSVPGILWSAALRDLQPFTPPPCAGDCNGDARVTVEELVAGVAIALGQADTSGCGTGFCNADCAAGPGAGRPNIACLISAVGALLDGCRPDRCRNDADCDDGNGCSIDQCSEDGCSSSCVCV
jgi:ELWxxDGT repeat protein